MSPAQPVVELSSSPVVEVTVNGETRSFPRGSNVLDLLREMNMRVELVAVEINRELIRRPLLADRTLNDQDRVEIVEFVGGG